MLSRAWTSSTAVFTYLVGHANQLGVAKDEMAVSRCVRYESDDLVSLESEASRSGRSSTGRSDTTTTTSTGGAGME